MEKQIKPCPFCGCIPEVKGDVVTHRHKDEFFNDVTHWMPLPEAPK